MRQPPDLFRRMIEASTDGLWIIDARGRTVYANDRMAAILGLEPAELTALDLGAVDVEAEGTTMTEHLRELAAGRPGRENVETRFNRADGSTVWGLVSWSPVPDDDGGVIGWLHRITPYTERKELVETLREREQQLTQSQEIARLGSWLWDPRDGTITWSDALYGILGADPATFEVTRESFHTVLHPDDRERVRAIADAALAGHEESTWEARVLLPSGEVRWVRGLGVAQRDAEGLPLLISGTIQDITDLKTADEQVQEATRRLHLLQRVAEVSNRATSLFEAAALTADGLTTVAPRWQPVAMYDVRDGAPTQVMSFETTAAVEESLVHEAARTGALTVGTPEGIGEDQSMVALPLQASGEVVAVAVLLSDERPPDPVSRELLEQVARQLGTVAERERAAAELAEARDQAMEASRLKSEFLATMSHEIRTPMNGVIGLNELLLRTELDDRQRRLSEGVQSAGLTLLEIINDILDLSKIEAGRLELEEADFDVRAVFDQVAGVLSGPAHTQGLELVVACHPDVPAFLRGDATRFGQVVTNLGSNAVKFTPQGEVVVRGSVVEDDGDQVVLRVEVRDTGVGIPAEVVPSLFDAFTQADPSTTRRHGGTGLGLAISQQLVAALGGTIEIESEPGVGSTFSFTARFGRAATPAYRAPATLPSLRGTRVLVVDDNETNRYILTEQLRAWEAEPEAVAGAEAALASLREAARQQRPFALALLDVVMPGTDGVELARWVRADPSLGATRLLMLSSDHSVGTRAIAQADADGALSKPVRHGELHDVLVATLARGTSTPAGRSGRRALDPRATAPRLGITVLVVEDNPVNQLVATGLLESLGAEVAVAGDGVEAVSMLSGDHPYAAVLMDCRMPRMDGYDATRAIRAAEPDGRRVPIIAMTASALEGERERCLAAGMDDFLTKPVDAAVLTRVVRRWTGPQAGVGPAPDPQDGLDTVETPVVGVVLDPARVRMLDELRKDGVSFFERTAASFTGRIGEQLGAIQDAIDARDATRAFSSAHLVKGSALNLGLPLVAAAAARVEAHAEGGSTRGTEPMMADLRREVARAVVALRDATA
ncbi:response regulator [Nocardioides dongkuii]|uniref:response regulator n=1 Tax=Nocardioides dongkuii TaxID=2760089 RepID=UPI0015FC4A1F|nr:response regulator [Nocardioides dongkuii]